MARTSNPDKYPAVCFDLLKAVQAKGEVFIAHDHPASFRGYLQAFLRSLEVANHPLADQARATMVRMAPAEYGKKGVVMCDRDNSPAARAIAKALGQVGSSAAAAEADFLKSLP